MNNSKLTTVARLLMGFIFVAGPLANLLHLAPQPAQPAAATAFRHALAATGYMEGLLWTCHIVPGLLLLSGAMVPLALAILAPVIVNIAAFHIFLAPGGIGPAILVTALELLLAWQYRAAFAPLFQKRPPKPAREPRPLRAGATALGYCALLVLATAASVHAQVTPGERITAQNAAKVKDIVSPGVYYMVQHGMQLQIVPTQRIDWPPPYKDATEKYSSQVRLSGDHRSLTGYVAGQPFPLIDINDPYAATKIMWNNGFRPITSDDYDLRFYDCQSQYANPGHPHRTIDDIQVGHYSGYSLVGRTEVEPIPTDPDFKRTNRLWLFALYPVLSPQDARGTGIVRYRYADGARGDDIWDWTPGTRRVRRLNETIMSTASGAQTFDPDHYSGFNAKTEFYDYKLLGEKPMLLSVHAQHSPEVTCATDGGASACPEDWEMRNVYVISATPRRANGASQALDSKSIVYLDSEVWFPPVVDTYDQRGELWRSNIYYLTYRDRPVPDAKVAIYPFKREFVIGADRVDLQSGFSTMCYLPGQTTPERECWYINMGAVDKEFCTVQAMAKAAP